MDSEDPGHPFVNLGDLDEPPQNWQQLRSREADLRNLYKLNELHALVVYHAYGFRCNKTFVRKQSYFDLLNKILYYTQTGLGNGTAFVDNSIICAGPVGPGTLSEDI
jgi:hypothetical protein